MVHSLVDGQLICCCYSLYLQLFLDYSLLHYMVRRDGIHRLVFWWKKVITIYELLLLFVSTQLLAFHILNIVNS